MPRKFGYAPDDARNILPTAEDCIALFAAARKRLQDLRREIVDNVAWMKPRIAAELLRIQDPRRLSRPSTPRCAVDRSWSTHLTEPLDNSDKIVR